MYLQVSPHIQLPTFGIHTQRFLTQQGLLLVKKLCSCAYNSHRFQSSLTVNLHYRNLIPDQHDEARFEFLLPAYNIDMNNLDRWSTHCHNHGWKCSQRLRDSVSEVLFCFTLVVVLEETGKIQAAVSSIAEDGVPTAQGSNWILFLLLGVEI